MPTSRASRLPGVLSLATVAALAVQAATAALAVANGGLALAPGVAFAWTDPGTEGLLSFQLLPRAPRAEPITAVRTSSRRLTVTGFRIGLDDTRLTLRVRADAAGVIEVPALLVETRFAPAQTVRVGAAEVVALPDTGGPLVLRSWASDDTLGLYAAFALVNEGAATVVVRNLRYAPEPLGRGLALVASGPAAGFAAWKDAVLNRMAPAYAAYLEGHGRSRYAPARAVRPAALAFPLRGALARSRWRAPTAIDIRLAPGQALYAAITPSAYAAYVDDLAIVAYPVVGYEVEGGAGCCHLQGVPAAIVHAPDRPASGGLGLRADELARQAPP